VTSGTGAFAANTVISSITNDSQFVVSATPTALSNANITCVRIWEHASLDTTDAKHTAPAGSTIKVPNDGANGVGAFIYRSSTGSGTFTLSDVGLVWKYGSNGIADDDYVSIKVFAIEMVYVPQGSFYVGDGSSQNNRFTQANSTSGNTVPFQITSTPPTLQGNDASASSSNLSTRGGGSFDLTSTNTASLASGFPTGYEAFYCMKYEVSQGQYRDFLNSLTRYQQLNCIKNDGVVGSYAAGEYYISTGTYSFIQLASPFSAASPINRVGLRLITNPSDSLPMVYGCDLNKSTSLPAGVNQSDDGESLAMGFLSWANLCSFLDWSGLRPMTELEFEKACRGNQISAVDEAAWGNSTFINATSLNNSGSFTETGSDSLGVPNVNLDMQVGNADICGMMRVGTFATASTNRTQSGGSYYGIMELSANAMDRCVSIGNVAGRSFTGLQGDGNLRYDGLADVSFWPGINGNTSASNANIAYAGTTGVVANGAGYGYRGGAWPFKNDVIYVSKRNNAADPGGVNSNSYFGGRGVRSQP
jgi:formylglycine-generating enzyme required for sulfatase activity